jgi:hypothetical protein
LPPVKATLVEETEMTSKLQVFVSSTFQDLTKDRQAAVEAILKAGHIPAGMELFTAGDKSQWEVIQRWITDSDVYMLILGGRYGSVEPSSGLSYTELEYDFAVASGKPHFAVIITEDSLEARVKELGTAVLEEDNLDKLKAFRKKVLGKMSSFFADHKDVKLSVLETLPQLAAEYELKGWVRASEIPDTKALADELSKVHAENRQLRDTLAQQAKQLEQQKSPTHAAEKEFAELIDVMTAIMVDVSAVKQTFGNAKEVPDKVSLFDLALSFKDMLMAGVTNQIGINDLTSFAFFTLCPKLQTYDLVQNEKVAGVRYRRYAITKKGTQFFAFVEKRLHAVKGAEQAKPGPKAKS